MNEKYKIYLCSITQSFNYNWDSSRWFEKIVHTDRMISGDLLERYILARTKQEAIEKYKNRYEWEFDKPLNYFWNWNNFKYVSNTPNWEHEVVAKLVNPTFNKLKEKLRAEEFLLYCKQEMYPLEVLIKEV